MMNNAEIELTKAVINSLEAGKTSVTHNFNPGFWLFFSFKMFQAYKLLNMFTNFGLIG